MKLSEVPLMNALFRLQSFGARAAAGMRGLLAIAASMMYVGKHCG